MSENIKKIQDLAQDIARLALNRATEVGLEAGEVIQATATAAVALTATTAKPGFMPHAMLSFVASLTSDAHRVIVLNEKMKDDPMFGIVEALRKAAGYSDDDDSTGEA